MALLCFLLLIVNYTKSQCLIYLLKVYRVDKKLVYLYLLKFSNWCKILNIVIISRIGKVFNAKVEIIDVAIKDENGDITGIMEVKHKILGYL